MTAKYSQRSLDMLATCDERLQHLFHEVIKVTDCSIRCGHRNEYLQNKAYNEGRSKLLFPNSKHNKWPSMAIDAVPWPIEWFDLQRMYMFVGMVRGVAGMLKIPIRCGADWDGDFDVKDQTFHDLPHFELVDKTNNGG